MPPTERSMTALRRREACGARFPYLSMMLCISLLAGCGSSPSTTISWSTQVPATPKPAPLRATPIPGPASPQAVSLPVLPDSPEQHLATELLSDEPGVYGFVVLENDGTVIASVNGTTPFITASLYKLLLMADIYQRIEQGSLDGEGSVVLDAAHFDGAGDMYFAFDDIGTAYPLQEYLFAVGAYSSNAAARTLLTFTDPASLRATAVAIGMEHTYLFTPLAQVPFWPPLPGVDASAEEVSLSQQYLEASAGDGAINITTPLDMARYQLALMNGTLISPWVSERIMAILGEQLIRDRLPFYFGETIRVLNKPGNLEDAVNDVGVLYLPDGPRAVAMLSQALPDDDRATLVLQRLALIASGSAEIPAIPAEGAEDDGDGE